MMTSALSEEIPPHAAAPETDCCCLLRFGAACLFLLLSCPNARCAEQAELPPAARPNIVWIFVEDMNDWMGCYGDPTAPTPNIDRLAETGLRYSRAYMPAGVCSATRSAIATGAMQTSLGVHNHRSSRNRVAGEVIDLPAGVQTVYELLRGAGYYVFSNPGKDDFNFEFERKNLYDLTLKQNMGFSGPEWRRRADGQPFFAQIQLKGGKNTGKFDDLVAGKSLATSPAAVDVPPYYPDVPAIREEIAHHYDCIRQTDDEVGQVLAALEQDGLRDSTVVFFFTDHGLRLYRHKQWLYEGGIRVPLVVSGPGVPANAVCDDLVSGIDITATTLALAKVAKPAWMEGFDLFAEDYQPRSHVISARDRCDYTIDRVRAVTTKRFKYLRNFMTDRPFMQPQYRDGKPFVEIPRAMHERGELDAIQEIWWAEERTPEELYDLEADPHEIHNLATDPTYQAVLQQHRDTLASWITKTDDKGRYPESAESLRGVLKRWKQQAVNPEYDAIR